MGEIHLLMVGKLKTDESLVYPFDPKKKKRIKAKIKFLIFLVILKVGLLICSCTLNGIIMIMLVKGNFIYALSQTTYIQWFK